MVHHNQAEMTSGEQDEPGLEQVTVSECSASGPYIVRTFLEWLWGKMAQGGTPVA